jgi:fructose-bisphosphate aldolase class I
MKENAKILAEYAHICQELDIVPIIEPEVLYDGDHTIEKCYEVTAKNFDILFQELLNKNIFIPGIILKTGMVLAGKDSKEKSTTEEIARMTLRCLNEHVPGHIGGIVFLSGGQTSEEALVNLNAMHAGVLPWPLTFSYSRAIQNPVLESWAKNPSDVDTAQALLLETAKNNSEASIGKYSVV